MSMNIYSYANTYSVPRPPEAILLLSPWPQRAAAALILAILIVIIEGISRRIYRDKSRVSIETDQVELCEMDSRVYRDFIKAEMMRFRREEEEEVRVYKKSQRRTNREDIGYRMPQIRHKEQLKIERLGEKQEQLLGGSAVSSRGYSSHSRLPNTRLSRGFKLETSPRIPTTPSNPARIITATPARNIKFENSPTGTPISSVRGFSSSTLEQYFTPSPPSVIPSSLPSLIFDSSPTSQLQQPATRPHLPRIIMPKPGDIVLRRRPASSFLKNTVDETDLFDGPFVVYSTAHQKWVELLLPEGSKTPPWVEVANIVLATNGQAKELHTGSGIYKDGNVLYTIGMLRGVRLRKRRRRGEEMGVNDREVLVHWKGWGCEDDTWEPEEGMPTEFVKDFEKRESEWRLGKRKNKTFM